GMVVAMVEEEADPPPAAPPVDAEGAGEGRSLRVDQAVEAPRLRTAAKQPVHRGPPAMAVDAPVVRRPEAVPVRRIGDEAAACGLGGRRQWKAPSEAAEEGAGEAAAEPPGREEVLGAVPGAGIAEFFEEPPHLGRGRAIDDLVGLREGSLLREQAHHRAPVPLAHEEGGGD